MNIFHTTESCSLCGKDSFWTWREIEMYGDCKCVWCNSLLTPKQSPPTPKKEKQK
jgi:hypothetical protein